MVKPKNRVQAYTHNIAGHFDAVEIGNQMEVISAAFQKLEQKVSTQKEQLSINYKVYQFNRDSEEMEDLINR